MKRLNKIMFLLLLMIITPVLSLVAFNYENETKIIENNEVFEGDLLAVENIQYLQLSTCPSIMEVGESATVGVSFGPGGAQFNFVFSSSGNIQITGQGGVSAHIQAVSPGIGHIEVHDTISGIGTGCTVRVLSNLHSISLSPSVVDVYTGDYKTITAVPNPGSATGYHVIFNIEDSNIAGVEQTSDQTARIIGRNNGTTYVHARAIDNYNGDTLYEKVARVNVTTKLQGITIQPSSQQLQPRQVYPLNIQYNPPTATNKTVTWSSSDSSVATVDGNGKVTAQANGDAVITAISQDGNYRSQSVIYVRTPLQGIDITPSTFALDNGASRTMSVQYTPATASNKTLSWTSSNNSVATVDSSGKVVGKGNGTATITAVSQDGNFRDTATVTVTTRVTGVTLNKTTTTINKNSTETLIATVQPTNASNKTVTWTSSNTAVATVDTNGKVTAKANGTSTITVKTAEGGFKATCVVTVVTPVSSISLNKTSTIIEVNKTETLVATIQPSTASDKTVTWESSNNNVATVDTNGKVTAKANGTATITATSSNGKKATCTVTVITPEDGIYLSKTQVTLRPGGTETITAMVLPANASNQTVTWSTTNSSVATVSGGKITAVAPGTATIKAKTNNGKEAICNVTVITPVTKVTLNKSSTVIAVGANETLTATVKPDDASDKGVTWTSSKPSVATVDANGKVVGVAEGKTTITVKTNDGSKTATCEVTVYIAVDGIHLSEESISLPKGNTKTLTYDIYPNNSTNQEVTWASDNPEVATVNQEGKVTAKEAGTAHITVTTNDGSKTATCEVKVTIPVTGVVIVQKEIYLDPSDTVKPKIEISPSTATNKNVSWTSSDNSIAIIEADGTIKPQKIGEVTITVETQDGGFKDTATLYVQVPIAEVKIDKKDIYLKPGQEIELTYTISPEDATDKTLTWRSSNEKVATVTQNGVVKGIAKGDAKIYVTDSRGVEQAVLSVTVNKTGSDNPETGLFTPIMFVIGLLAILFVILKASKNYKPINRI